MQLEDIELIETEFRTITQALSSIESVIESQEQITQVLRSITAHHISMVIEADEFESSLEYARELAERFS